MQAAFAAELSRRDALLQQMQTQMAALASAQTTAPTPPPPPPPPQTVTIMPGVVDLRLLGKPEHLDGGSHCRDWSMVFRSYAGAVSGRLGQLMTAAEQSTTPVLTTVLPQPRPRERARGVEESGELP